MVVQCLHTLATEAFLRPYKLQETTLIIDGNCVSYTIYVNNLKYLNHNFCKGFSEKIRSFLKSLRDCNVTPIIIIYGGSQDIKLKTILKRTKSDIRSASRAVNIDQRSMPRPIPMLLKEIMKQVASEMNIKCVQSLVDTEHDIASVAKILKCPVLSDNSDFFLYGVDFIPFDCRKFQLPNCGIYRTEHVSVIYKGLDARTLPILDVLIGEENVEPETFSGLAIMSLDLAVERKKYGRICKIFEWLRHHTLESAISELLDNLDRSEQPKILRIIEKVVTKFLTVSPNMLFWLGYSQDKVDNLVEGLPMDPYKYKGPRNFSDTPAAKDECLDFLDLGNGALTVNSVNEDDVCKLAPAWFVQEFRAATFPSYFIDMMTRQLYVCAIQMEDFDEPTCVQVSLKIIKVIFALLNAGTSNSNILRFIARGSPEEARIYEMNCDDPIPGFAIPAIPSLESLRSCSVSVLREIFVKTMGVSKELLDEFPPEWSLYIATIKYWQKEADERFTEDCFLYSLLMAIAHFVVYSPNRLIKQENRGFKKFTVGEALKIITDGEKAVAKYTFQALLTGKPPFNLRGVHAFALFENCLKHSIHLNALLNKPYPEINIANLYNDGLIYQTYIRLKDIDDATLYIRTIFGASPGLVVLLNTITSKLAAFSS